MRFYSDFSRGLLRLAIGLMTAAAIVAAPAVANADSSSTLTVVGTSDVSDSGLIQNVVQPAFHAAFPNITFKYIGTATGTAITDAESGSVGASALIVHAASLENQFVANGFSYNKQYGNAIWTNDFVLAGPSSDPAGVGANGSHNIAQAFADIAAAGINGGGTPKVTFVSRGGTPGTTVEEHQIWALVASSGLEPAGLTLCTVSAANGGGETPIASTSGVANGAPCPNGALPSGSALPKWYIATGLTQGPNVIAANTCTATGVLSGANSCYVLTDRGTYDYLASGLDPAGTIPSLTILTRGPQPASAPGGVDALVNYFHAYIINPSKPGESVNLTAAQDFVNLITSPAVQSQLKLYLDDTSDPAGAPFVADASPNLTATGLPSTSTLKAGSAVTVTGQVTNAEPGYPALSGVPVTVDELISGLSLAVANTTTGANGSYSVSFMPPTSAEYEVTTGQISQVEDSSLSPVFGDILSPAATSPVFVTVSGSATAPSSSKPTAGSHLVRFTKVSVHKTRVTAKGALTPAPAKAGATVQLFAMNSSGGHERRIASTRVKAHKKAFTLKAKLRKGRWILQLKYVQKGQQAAYSGLKSVRVR